MGISIFGYFSVMSSFTPHCSCPTISANLGGYFTSVYNLLLFVCSRAKTVNPSCSASAMASISFGKYFHLTDCSAPRAVLSTFGFSGVGEIPVI